LHDNKASGNIAFKHLITHSLVEMVHVGLVLLGCNGIHPCCMDVPMDTHEQEAWGQPPHHHLGLSCLPLDPDHHLAAFSLHCDPLHHLTKNTKFREESKNFSKRSYSMGNTKYQTILLHNIPDIIFVLGKFTVPSIWFLF
jgi:hypothetical protein